MEMNLHSLKSAPHRRHRRVGRGNASRGTYSGRGMKGQRARSGGRGGLQQRALKSIVQRLPKMGGFRSLQDKAAVVTLTVLDKNFSSGAVVTMQSLKAKKLIPKSAGRVKVLATGTLTKALTVKGCTTSAGAQAKIVAAGGNVAAK